MRKHLLRHLAIPYHHAPGEAEAECSRLQQAGIVDAVWTDDGDTLMFGTTMLIRTSYEKTGSKSKTHVQVFRAKDIKRRLGLDQNAFVLFAILAGGDCKVKGLPGCGSKTAMRLAREGFGDTLPQLNDYSAHIWRMQLQAALRGQCTVPNGFPNMRAFKYYIMPTVSSLEQLHNLAERWDKPIREAELRTFLRTHYNIQIKGYIKHIVPILLLRILIATSPGGESANEVYGIELTKTRKRPADDGTAPDSLLRKTTFLPQPVTTLDITQPPIGTYGEDWSQLANPKTGAPYDATARAPCEMLECILQMGVPQAFHQAIDEAAEKSAHSPMKRNNKRSLGLDSPPPENPTCKRSKKSTSRETAAGTADHGLEAAKSTAVDRIDQTVKVAAKSPPPENNPTIKRPTFRPPPGLAVAGMPELKPPLTIISCEDDCENDTVFDKEVVRIVPLASSLPSSNTFHEERPALNPVINESLSIVRAKRLARFGGNTPTKATDRTTAIEVIVLD